jgi:hypothetical protein
MYYSKIRHAVGSLCSLVMHDSMFISHVETGSRNERRLCAVFYNRTPGFETIHGLLDRIMDLLRIDYNEKKTNDHGYYLNNSCQGNDNSRKSREKHVCHLMMMRIE